MCEAIEGIRNDAREEGFLEALVGLVKDGILTIADAAKRANMTAAEFEQKMSIRTDTKEKLYKQNGFSDYVNAKNNLL